MKVLVVGSNPSKKHGKSPTLKILYKWLDFLELNIVSFINVYRGYTIKESESDLALIDEISKDYDKIIAIGKIASYALESKGIKHVMIPHPSPQNRLLNNPRYVKSMLEYCKKYLAGN